MPTNAAHILVLLLLSAFAMASHPALKVTTSLSPPTESSGGLPVVSVIVSNTGNGDLYILPYNTVFQEDRDTHDFKIQKEGFEGKEAEPTFTGVMINPVANPRVLLESGKLVLLKKGESKEIKDQTLHQRYKFDKPGPGRYTLQVSPFFNVIEADKPDELQLVMADVDSASFDYK